MTDRALGPREVFISYSTRNKKWADAACAVLEKHRVRCWIAPRDIRPGSEWGAAIMGGMASCRVMVLIFSSDANASPQVRREVERAISKGMAVLPFRVEDVLPEGALEYALGNTHWLDGFTPPAERHLEALAAAVQALIGAEPPVVAPVPVMSRRKWPRAVVTGVVAVLLMFGGVGYLLRPAPSAPAPGESPRVAATEEAPPEGAEPVITNTLGMRLRLIPAGDFDMGSDGTDPDAQEGQKVGGQKHRVRITRPFYLGETEVTVGQFRKFVERAKYKTEAERDGKGGYGRNEGSGGLEQDHKYLWSNPGFPQTDDHPVTNVSHNDAVAFCDWLSQEEGQAYRLPTEAEWEYSCRAGQASRYWFGDDLEGLAAVGNVADGTARAKFPRWTFAIAAKDGFVFSAPVGRFPANAFGLFDMHGNVSEWCSDWYAAGYYANSSPGDPPNSSPASMRTIRGGCWYDSPRSCRSAFRGGLAPVARIDGLGFRLARVP